MSTAYSIRTDRLILRPLHEADVDVIVAYRNLECSRKNGDVVYAASSWMCLNPSSYSCGVK